jgi:hypothetical protein
MYSSAFCNVGLQVYNLKSPNLSLDEVYLSECVWSVRRREKNDWRNASENRCEMTGWLRLVKYCSFTFTCGCFFLLWPSNNNCVVDSIRTGERLDLAIALNFNMRDEGFMDVLSDGKAPFIRVATVQWRQKRKNLFKSVKSYPKIYLKFIFKTRSGTRVLSKECCKPGYIQLGYQQSYWTNNKSVYSSQVQK